MDESKKKVKDEYDIENLEGVGPVTAKKMIEAGIFTIYDIVSRDPVQMKEITGWTLEEGNDIISEDS